MPAPHLYNDTVSAWLGSRPEFSKSEGNGVPDRDVDVAAESFNRGADLLGRLPPRVERDGPAAEQGEAVHRALDRLRTDFLRAHAESIYRELTRDGEVTLRADELVYRAADRFPGLVPTRQEVRAESKRLQKEKEGLEIAQGIFFSQILSHRWAGSHLIHSMLQPTRESIERRDGFLRSGTAELGAGTLERRGSTAILSPRNDRYLNAEDDSTVRAMELGVDLALLDPTVEVCVLRGSHVEHPRYAGRRVFSAGLNLSHLYEGKISYLFYLTRDLGFVNKMYRGLAGPDFHLDEPESTTEKPWIAGVESFAIGGGCQILLAMDRVLAERGSYFNLPACKEGIIPGTANLRLPRRTGDRLARAAILFDSALPADSAEGRLLCDEVVPEGEMDVALDRAVQQLTGSGLVSAAGNRKALRAAEEPIDVFRQYMATYAREQAYCHFSPALIRNLERYWTGRNRRA